MALPRSLEVRTATPDDVETAAAILEEAIDWLAERGLEAWEPGTFRDPNGRGRRVLEEAQRAGHLHLLRSDGEPVGTVTLQPTDQLFWPDAPEDALYVHRLALARRAHGERLGEFLVDFARRSALAQGKHCLRLDCLAGDQALCRYYERLGFEHRGDVPALGRAFSLYERPLVRRRGGMDRGAGPVTGLSHEGG